MSAELKDRITPENAVYTASNNTNDYDQGTYKQLEEKGFFNRNQSKSDFHLPCENLFNGTSDGNIYINGGWVFRRDPDKDLETLLARKHVAEQEIKKSNQILYDIEVLISKAVYKTNEEGLDE